MSDATPAPGQPQLPPRLIVPPEAAGMRLDTWLSRRPGSPSRNRVQQLVKDGFVLVDGDVAKRSHELTGGETVDIEWPPAEDAWPFPEDIPIDVVYEDEDVIIVNKAAGMIVHPSAGHPDHTLVNALVFRYPDLPGINGVRRPGIVHRLDRDTTGLLVVAKNDLAMTSLARQLAARTVKRTYICIAMGDPKWDELTVDAAIGADPVNRLRRAIDGPFAKAARSHFTVLRRSGQFTMIQCNLETGRTHQIRIHLKHVGHPIVCDEAYDGGVPRCVERLTNTQHELKRAFQHFARPWLHARTLSFHHPGRNEQVSFTVPPPEDSQAVARLIFGEVVDELMRGEGN
ncbi:RluA family pseudouridine synthase [Candidatus Sumerlaeota bacterium]|nr:RluA family pseudouridine synthase [Candidatus Sumerlaeota bacterium]